MNHVFDSRPINFDNSYRDLPARFFTAQKPVPVARPALLALNLGLANELGLDPHWLRGPDGLAMLAGNRMPPGAAPLAQVYGGHQFGIFVPQLGDGRAVLLGEVIDRAGTRRDIQLKGSGRTPYSRGGDGRAWLGPVLREYLVSEAMSGLEIPTTRTLAAVATGETVQRETALPGAVLTRIAASHIRVGTFQYFAARGDTGALRLLSDHVMARHYPHAETPLDMLNGVIARQASLIAGWMSVGFIHGVMNTDNMAVSGETIDYGPCAFIDDYSPGKVFSSIDHAARYAYGRQPAVAQWNLTQFANCLLPLIGESEVAIAAATAALNRFSDLFDRAWGEIFLRKIGLRRAEDGDRALVARFLAGLAESGGDFTNSFRDLTERRVAEPMQGWRTDWLARLAREDGDIDATLRAANPAYIARNHRVQAMIAAAVDGDMAPFETLHRLLKTPFEDQPDFRRYRAPPQAGEVVHNTFCGT
ncbi:MAG: YdiU family protein [Paracoccaceae bacterium]